MRQWADVIAARTVCIRLNQYPPMEETSLFERYQELQRYVNWSWDDQQRTTLVGRLLAPAIPRLVDGLYEVIEQHPPASRVVTGGAAQVARLKQSLTQWLRELFTGPYDGIYVERRSQVGCRHVAIGLGQVFTNAAIARLRIDMTEMLQQHCENPQQAFAAIGTLNKLLDLDLAIIADAYESAHAHRLQAAERTRMATEVNEAQQRALQAERLAGIGQMSTGLAHESRNALQRIQACAEMLELEVEGNAAALDLVRRIKLAQDDMHRLFDEVRGYAGPVNLDRADCHLRSAWREAWEILVPQREGRTAELVEEPGDLQLVCYGDHYRLVQLFRILLENSLAACQDPVRIEITCTPATWAGCPATQIAVHDNGPGLNAEQRERIMEPFYTTKTKGTGLGMAIAQRIVEAHHGALRVGDSNRPGTEIVIILPSASAD